jgi:hypothetical protein
MLKGPECAESASQFRAAWISPSLPQNCGGEGTGEEALWEVPLSLSLSPLARGEGIEICARAKTLPKIEMRPYADKYAERHCPKGVCDIK